MIELFIRVEESDQTVEFEYNAYTVVSFWYVL